MRRIVVAVALVVAPLSVVVGAVAAGTAPAGAQTFVNWPAYEFGPGHSSVSPQATTFTTGNASTVVKDWEFIPPTAPKVGSTVYSSPTVYRGRVFLGADNGNFYAIDEATGHVVWQRAFGFQPAIGCPARGFVSTATVALDPNTGSPTVYVAAPDGYLYAMRASDGTTVWQSPVAIPSTTQNDYFNWSSPTVANGKIYVGVASGCDIPLVQGGERAYDQASGAQLASFQTNPTGDLGGDIWSSAMVASDGSIFVTTGNQQGGGAIGDSESIIHLDGTTLAPIDIFTIPPAGRVGDGDFGASATSWSAPISGVPTTFVGACNKNGNFYALRESNLAAGPVWTDQLGTQEQQAGQNSICVASALFDSAGGRLFLSGNVTTIGSTVYRGSIQEVNPSTGAPIWQTGLPGSVLGTPTMDGSGLISVATADFTGAPNADYLIDPSNGNIVATLSTNNNPAFSQPVFADNFILLGSRAGVFAYTVPSTLSLPTVTGVSPAQGPEPGGTTVTITGTNFTNATGVSFGGTAATSFTVNSATQITATSPPGTGTVDVTVTTPAGTSAIVSTDTFAYGTSVSLALSPPSLVADGTSTTTATATVLDPQGNPATSENVSFSTSGTQSIGPVTNNGNGTYSATVTASTVTGSYTVSATDTSVSPAVTGSNTLLQTDPTSLPTVTGLNPTSGPSTGGTTVIISGTSFTGAKSVHFGANAVTSFTVNSSTQITATAPPASPTAKPKVNVTVTNVKGVSAHVAADAYTYTPAAGPPSVSGVSPNSGPGKGGTSVIVTGSGFTGATAVTFGTKPAATFTATSDTSITATSPSGTGTVDVTVTTPAGTSTINSADTFTYGPSISLTLAPTSIPADGVSTSVATAAVEDASGNPLTSQQVGFTTSGAQTIGPVTNHGDGTYSATVTASTAVGSSTITATDTTPTPHLSATSTLTQTGATATPTVTGINPTSGTTAGGTTVSVSGTNFVGVSAVHFGSSVASSIHVVSPTSLTATSPARGAGVVNVTVTNSKGTSTHVTADRFTYVAAPAPPTVTGLNPSGGPGIGGTSVTIIGTGFTGATAVSFGGHPAQSFAVSSSTQISAVSPSGTGAVDVTVTTPNGTSATSTSDVFTYGESISLMLSPSSIAADGSSTSTASAAVVDANGNPLTAETVVFSSSGSQTIGPVTNNGNGTYTATITSTTTPGSATITATDTTPTPQLVATATLTQTGATAVPTVTSVSPTSGPSAGGTTVTVMGTNFTGVTGVHFASNAGTSIQVLSSTELTVVSPALTPGGHLTVNVTVTNAKGVSAHVAADRFTYT